jgi:hypothetical protein
MPANNEDQPLVRAQPWLAVKQDWLVVKKCQSASLSAIHM